MHAIELRYLVGRPNKLTLYEATPRNTFIRFYFYHGDFLVNYHYGYQFIVLSGFIQITISSNLL